MLKEINPEYSLEGLTLKLKLQYFGHLMQIADSLEKILMWEKIEGRRRRGQPRTRCLDAITGSMDMNLGKPREMVKDSEAWRAAVHGVAKSWTWLSDWTTMVSLFSVPLKDIVMMILSGAETERKEQKEKDIILLTEWVISISKRKLVCCLAMKARKTTARTYRFTGLLLVDPAALSIVNNLIKTEAVRILILGFVSPGIVKKKKKKNLHQSTNR